MVWNRAEMLHVGLEIVRRHKTDGRAEEDGGGGYLHSLL